jgi:hypothetical protein
VYSLPQIATAANYKARMNAFFLLICGASLVAGLKILYLAYATFDPSSVTTMNTLQRTLNARMMERGAIPPLIILTLALPSMATPAGFSPKLARIMAAVNSVVLFALCAFIYQKISVSCVPECTELQNSDRLVTLVHDAMVSVAILVIAFLACVPMAEVGEEVVCDLVSDLAAGREADSVLNHIIKNSMANVRYEEPLSVLLCVLFVCSIQCLYRVKHRAILEIELMEKPTQTSLSAAEIQRNRALKDALSEINLSMAWIASRQVLLEMSAGTYETSMSPVNIKDFFKTITAGSEFRFHDATQTLAPLQPGEQIAFDEKMARLAFENGKTNALFHGDKGVVDLCAKFRRDGSFCVLLCC